MPGDDTLEGDLLRNHSQSACRRSWGGRNLRDYAYHSRGPEFFVSKPLNYDSFILAKLLLASSGDPKQVVPDLGLVRTMFGSSSQEMVSPDRPSEWLSACCSISYQPRNYAVFWDSTYAVCICVETCVCVPYTVE